jgi:hypothetical protein
MPAVISPHEAVNTVLFVLQLGAAGCCGFAVSGWLKVEEIIQSYPNFREGLPHNVGRLFALSFNLSQFAASLAIAIELSKLTLGFIFWMALK